MSAADETKFEIKEDDNELLGDGEFKVSVSHDNNTATNPLLRPKSWLVDVNNNAIDQLLQESNSLLDESHEITEPFQSSINLETNKERLVMYLQTKIDKVTQRIRLVEHKYGEYKKLSDMVNIGIILLSTLLTLLESLRAELDPSTLNGVLGSSFNLFPIVISTTITCAAAILKFKKLQEKMEGISRTVDKCIFAIARIKKCQEDILFLEKQEELNEVKVRYHKDIYEYYNACNQDIEKYLKIEDYGKYLKTLNDIDINILILERDKQKRERYIENDFTNYMKILKKKEDEEKDSKMISLRRRNRDNSHACLLQ